MGTQSYAVSESTAAAQIPIAQPETADCASIYSTPPRGTFSCLSGYKVSRA